MCCLGIFLSCYDEVHTKLQMMVDGTCYLKCSSTEFIRHYANVPFNLVLTNIYAFNFGYVQVDT